MARRRLGLMLLSVGTLRLAAELSVATNFSSGSARVLALDAATQTLRITPAGDPARGMPNWWYLRVDGIDPARPFNLEVVAREVTTPNDNEAARPLNPLWTLPKRAAVSGDGKLWTQSPPGEPGPRHATYRIMTPPPTLWLAWGPPFTPEDAVALAERTGQVHPSARSFTLARSREGRAVAGLHFLEGDKPSAQRPAVWVTGRQHAWECGGSWVGVGLAEWLAGDDRQAGWLRRNAEVFLVPVMDVDHVASGDGGKHASPHDHNRDWTDNPHWPEVAAVQKEILARAWEGRLAVYLDLHNPSPWATLQTFYVQYPPYVGESAAAAQERFLTHARAEFGEIRLIDGKPSVPAHRPIWERISAPWTIQHGNPETVSLTVETPWNTPQATPEGYRETGRKLGLALSRYLQERAARPTGH